MKKRIVAIVAIVALIAIVAVCLVCLTACNADSIAKKLENKGYEAAAMSADDISEEYGDDASIKWAVTAGKIDGLDSVTVIKFAKADDAKEFAEAMESLAALGGGVVDRVGSIVYMGTEQGVKDAK